MEILELAKYWYYRIIDTFTKNNISKDKKLDEQFNKIEMFLEDSIFDLKKGLSIKDKVLLRIQASSYYGKDFKEYIKELKTGVFKILWDKEPGGITWDKYFANKPTDYKRIDYAALKRIHPYNRNAMYSIVEMIGVSNTEDKIDEITFNNEIRSIHISENKNLEIVDLIPSAEEFAETYSFYFKSKGTGSIRTEQNQEILDDLELLLKNIQPSLKVEFEKFLLSIGMNDKETNSLNGASNQNDDTPKRNKDYLKNYPINSIFPNINCKDLQWSNVGFDYCSLEKIEIKIIDRKKKISIKEFGLKNSSNIWKILFTFSSKNGFIDYPTLFRILDTKHKNTIQKNISRLNKHFKIYFGIGENPIVYDYSDKSYHTKLLYFRNSYLREVKKQQDSDTTFINSEFEEIDENSDYTN